MAFDDEPLGMAPPMSQSTAYLGVILAVIAETIFLFAWLSDQKNSELKKWAVLLWPLFLVLLADAIRTCSPSGRREYLRRQIEREARKLHYGDKEVEKINSATDTLNMICGRFMVCGLPLMAIALGLYLLQA